jgi:hypothetical protein
MKVFQVRKLRVVLPTTLHEWQHKGEHFFHMSYLGFTFAEGHGFHAKAAGALFCCVFAGVFLRQGAGAE